MNLLAIDTSTERASVAVMVGSEIKTREQGHLRQHAQCLLPMIDELLQACGITLKQLDGLVFGCGPGSFTGLRIACSVAQGLAYAHDCPLYPVTSLHAVAADVLYREPALNTPVLAMLDARMQEVYWAYYTTLEASVDIHVSPVSDIIIPTHQPFVLAGVGLELYAAQFPMALQEPLIKQLVVYPNAETMIRLAHSGQIRPIHAQDARPFYVRHQVTQGGTRG